MGVGRPLAIDGDDLLIDGAHCTIPDDQYGLALAFVEFVNRRLPTMLSPHEQVNDGIATLLEPVPGTQRFQYAVVGVGLFKSPERMAEVLSSAGENGWELVTVYDKASNWWAGMEQGLMLLKRPIPEDVEIDRWCIIIRN
jgi:hypothetical protein